jgi:hypothetical protein
MFFVVYVDADGIVFDWDWERADIDGPGFAQRFRREVMEPQLGDLLLEAVRKKEKDLAAFRAWHPWYSVSGDCVFCYFKDTESYAERVDGYLTRYNALGKADECVGFKLKCVSTLIELVRRWAQDDSEGIAVHFSPDNVTVHLEFLMRAWLMRNLPRRVALTPAMQLIQRIEQEQQDVEVVIPRSALEMADTVNE